MRKQVKEITMIKWGTRKTIIWMIIYHKGTTEALKTVRLVKWHIMKYCKATTFIMIRRY